jgi:hypothetical protein
MIANLIAVCVWDYFVVNRALPRVNKEMAGLKSSQHATAGYDVEENQDSSDKRLSATVDSAGKEKELA